jgi:hypothetical protein
MASGGRVWHNRCIETSSRRRLAGSSAGQSRHPIRPSPLSRIARLPSAVGSRPACWCSSSHHGGHPGGRDSASTLAQLSHKDAVRPRKYSIPTKPSALTAQISLLSVSTCRHTWSASGCIQCMRTPPSCCRGGLIASMGTLMVAIFLHRCHLVASRP